LVNCCPFIETLTTTYPGISALGAKTSTKLFLIYKGLICFAPNLAVTFQACSGKNPFPIILTLFPP